MHVARRLAALGGGAAPDVTLAAALAVRAPRLGHVYVDLATVRDTAAVETEEPVDLSELPWPEPEAWVAALAASGLVAAGEEDDRPLRLLGTCLYLDRYWREERRLAADLAGFSAAPAGGVKDGVLGEGLARLFAPPWDGNQRLAAAAAVLRRFAVVAGGPGTGKTTIVARIVALLAEQAAAAGAAAPLVALAAPTGKAAARLEEAVHAEARGLPVALEIRAQLLGLSGFTLHRLLGRDPASHSRFRHRRANRLPYDVVVVDETSMVSLWLMARLVEAVRPEARLILVGDPGQLTSIEAGAVLGDIVGPAAHGLRMTPAASARLAEVTGQLIDAAPGPPVGDGIVVLDRVHRYGEGIAALAGALRRGDADRVLDVLARAPAGVTWIADPGDEAALAPVRDEAVAAYGGVIAAAAAGNRPAGARAPRRLPPVVRPPARRARRRDLDRAGRGLARGRDRHGALVSRAAAAGDGERLRAAAVQRRHGRGRGGGAGPRPGGVRARRRGARGDPRAARGRRDRVRDDGAQEPGLAVRHRGARAAAAGVAHPHARAALHGGHARAGTADPGRDGSGRAGRRGPARGARLRAAPAAVGRPRRRLSRPVHYAPRADREDRRQARRGERPGRAGVARAEHVAGRRAEVQLAAPSPSPLQSNASRSTVRYACSLRQAVAARRPASRRRRGSRRRARGRPA